VADTALGERLERGVRERAARAGALAAVRMETALKTAWQPHRDTGQTTQAIKVQPLAFSSDRIEYLAEARTPQAEWVNDGTVAHGPVTAPFLVFTPKGSSRKVFTTWVKGIVGDHWWDNTVQQWSEFVDEALSAL
jgi:hypothetical protein